MALTVEKKAKEANESAAMMDIAALCKQSLQQQIGGMNNPNGTMSAADPVKLGMVRSWFETIEDDLLLTDIVDSNMISKAKSITFGPNAQLLVREWERLKLRYDDAGTVWKKLVVYVKMWAVEEEAKED